ncbi:BsuPI-related putative proteinase inhibitor [Paenibacillus sp. VCA1]|uniref:BsuPI-related putative proteinase inhibitor n=1 Tax=Paenibacillus sp. VCA1 TaxID=3039148 RepID=UPI00287187B9|nr:BsuPI-related putative proteinase inhibitor [Paenibacillus sp. VCA1]MDR9854764.1 BsuPI-related putative proteinase inhibitor [Paenibacillus sp. VCA1]
MNKLTILIFVVILITFCNSCDTLKTRDLPSGNYVKNEGDLETQTKKRMEPISKVMKTSIETIKEEDRITILFNLRNISGKDQLIHYGSQNYEMLINNEDNEEVYRWSTNRVFPMKSIQREFKNEEVLSYKETWDFKDVKGRHVSKGRYKIKVVMLISIDSENRSLSTEDLTATTVVEVL